jgi:hypothetical protein
MISLNSLRCFAFAVIILLVPAFLGASNQADEKEAGAGVPAPAQKGPVDVMAPPTGDRPLDAEGRLGKTTPPSPGDMPVYVPPRRGAPGGRVGGGTRGVGDKPFLLSVLAPDHVGLTIQDQPCLYWFISNLPAHPIEFTLIKNRAIKPLLEVVLDRPPNPGIQCIRLSDYGLRLEPETLYRWFVTLVPDPDRRSRDILSGGVIQRVPSTDTLQKKLDDSERRRAPHIYAEASLWYDAWAVLSDLLEGSPNDVILRNQRMSLLKQAGLPEVVEYDTKRSLRP